MIQVQYRPLSALKKHHKNPRTIKDTSFKKLVTSIRENPDYFEARPIILSDRTGELVIIAGNQRFEAAKDIGIKDVPTALLPDLTEEKEREIMIRDNIANGDWDWDMLANEWDSAELNEWGLDVPVWDDGNNAGQTDPDDAPEPEEEVVSVLGDLWILGEHRLICGDSSDPVTFERLLGTDKIDMVFTDPPYGVCLADKNKMLNSFQPSGRNLTEIKNDHLKPDELKALLTSVFTLVKKHSADHCSYYVAAPHLGELSMMMMMMMTDAGLPIRHVLIWVKNQPTFSMNRLDYDYQHEQILYCWNKRHEFQAGGQHKTSIWPVDKPRESKLHPTMKPVELVENALLNSSKPGWINFEPFCGSGTAIIAAEKTGRRCRAIELSENYCDVIVKRWQEFTGKIATLESTGETFEEVKHGRAS